MTPGEVSQLQRAALIGTHSDETASTGSSQQDNIPEWSPTHSPGTPAIDRCWESEESVVSKDRIPESSTMS